MTELEQFLERVKALFENQKVRYTAEQVFGPDQ